MIKVIANGCFDILHEGHLQLLKEAKNLGRLIILLNSDESVTALKGTGRPFNNEEIRKQNLINTGFVDEVIFFDDENDLLSYIKTIKPDFLVKGVSHGYYTIVGSKEIEEWGGKVHLVKYIDNYSTSLIAALNHKIIVVTGGMGFIGSNFIKFLNDNKITNIYIVDDLKSNSDKWKNIADLDYIDVYDYRFFSEAIKNEKYPVDFIINLGACSSTSENDLDHLWHLNTDFTRQLIKFVSKNRSTILLHASSAATYGLSDNFKERVKNITPLNKYGFSKLVSDKLISDVVKYDEFYIFSFRFFNVYGPRETYKGDMKSIVTKFIQEDIELKNNFPDSLLGKTMFEDTRPFKCYKSYKKEVPDGEMKRDFIYVEDVCKILFHFMLNYKVVKKGIYNVGTGKSESVNEVLNQINPYRKISYIEMPEKLKYIYQYFTESNNEKLINKGKYNFGFTSLKDGIEKSKEFYNNL